MPKVTKRTVDSLQAKENDYIIWYDDLPGFGLRVFSSGKRSYTIQYRFKGRSRRYTIGLHGKWTAEAARVQAKVQFGRIAQGIDPAEEKKVNCQAITVRQLCDQYIASMKAGLVLGKGGRSKKQSTVSTDIGRIERHIVPLIGSRRVKDIARSDVVAMMKDIMTGKTKMSATTGKLRGKAVVKGGAGTAARTVGLFGGILTFAIEAGYIETNSAHGIRKPKYKVRTRRLTESEYRILGRMLQEAEAVYPATAEISRLLALTGCRRSEIINLVWTDVDFEGSCIRLSESKEGYSVRPIGLPVLERLEARARVAGEPFVFSGWNGKNAFGGLPGQWNEIFRNSVLSDVTPHVLRHSFASIANDLGFTEATVAALVGHAKGSVTSNYIHTVDTMLIAAADIVSGYIQGLLDGLQYKNSASSFDRKARRSALDSFLSQVRGENEGTCSVEIDGSPAQMPSLKAD